MFLYKIVISDSDTILASNFPKHLEDIDCNGWTLKNEVCSCELTGKRRRQQKIITERYTIYLAAFDSSFPNKKFSIYKESCVYFADRIFPKYLQSIEAEQKRFRRLRHNIISLSTKITNELYQIAPQDSLIKGGRNQIQLIADIITTDPIGVAEHILKILKSSTLMKSEFDVYDMLHSQKPNLDFYNHSIHKVINLSLNAYWLDFLVNDIQVEIEDNRERVKIDYTSMSVVLSHVFDNAIKYCAFGTDLSITFADNGDFLEIIFEMTSVKINKDEIYALYNEGVSGFWADKIDLAGDGIGMSTVSTLMDLNEGDVTIVPNVNEAYNVTIEGVPYERNQIILEVKKAVTNKW